MSWVGNGTFWTDEVAPEANGMAEGAIAAVLGIAVAAMVLDVALIVLLVVPPALVMVVTVALFSIPWRGAVGQVV